MRNQKCIDRETDERLGAREWTVRERGGSGGLLAGVSGGLEPARV